MFKYKWVEWWHSFRLSNTQRSACFLLERLQEEHTGAGAVWLEVQDRRRPRPGFLGPGNGVEMECAVPSQETWVCHFTCRMRLPHLWKAILRIDWFFLFMFVVQIFTGCLPQICKTSCEGPAMVSKARSWTLNPQVPVNGGWRWGP